MKIAIIFTGFVRSFEMYGHSLHEKLLNIFKDPDIYYCTWDTIDSNNPKKIDKKFLDDQRCVGSKILKWNFFENIIPKTIPLDRENDIYKVNKFAMDQGYPSSNRIRSQWYLVRQAVDLIPDNYYDVIIRSRFDLNYTDVKIEKIESGITIPYNFFSVHYAKNVGIESGFCDHMAYGDSVSMKTYLKMYDYFDKMYIEENANIAHAEGMLKYYLKTHTKTKIHFNNNILYQIIKNQFDVDSTPIKKYEYENNIA